MSNRPVVVVTGAAGGIGNSTVRFLLEQHNACVVASDIVSGNLDELAKKYPKALTVRLGNITKPELAPELVRLALDNYGRLDGLCLLAGTFGPCHRLESSDPRDWVEGFEINVFSHVYMYRAALSHLRETRGRVVCATSGAGHGALFAGWSFYGMSKAALAFSISQLGLEEPEITSVGVAPGLCDTKMVQGLIKGQYPGQTDEDVRRYNAFVSKLKMITPDEAGSVMASVVVLANNSLSGRVFDYNDARLPGNEHMATQNSEGTQGHIDYSTFT